MHYSAFDRNQRLYVQIMLFLANNQGIIMIFTFTLIMLLSVTTLAAGFIVYHYSRSHNAARKNSVLLKIAGAILIAGGLASFALNAYIYERFREEGKIEELLPFEIVKPLNNQGE